MDQYYFLYLDRFERAKAKELKEVGNVSFLRAGLLFINIVILVVAIAFLAIIIGFSVGDIGRNGGKSFNIIRANTQSEQEGDSTDPTGHEHQNAPFKVSPLLQFLVIYIICTILLIVHSVLGITAAGFTSVTLIQNHIITTIIFLIPMIIVTFAGSLISAQLEDVIREVGIHSLATSYTGEMENPVTFIWDYIQRKLKCCGTNEGSDYDAAVNWKTRQSSVNETSETDRIKEIPTSCCMLAVGHEKVTSKNFRRLEILNEDCPYTTAYSYYHLGCFYAIKDYLSSHKMKVVLVSIAIIILFFLGLIISLALRIKYRKLVELKKRHKALDKDFKIDPSQHFDTEGHHKRRMTNSRMIDDNRIDEEELNTPGLDRWKTQESVALPMWNRKYSLDDDYIPVSSHRTTAASSPRNNTAAPSPWDNAASSRSPLIIGQFPRHSIHSQDSRLDISPEVHVTPPSRIGMHKPSGIPTEQYSRGFSKISPEQLPEQNYFDYPERSLQRDTYDRSMPLKFHDELPPYGSSARADTAVAFRDQDSFHRYEKFHLALDRRSPVFLPHELDEFNVRRNSIHQNDPIGYLYEPNNAQILIADREQDIPRRQGNDRRQFTDYSFPKHRKTNRSNVSNIDKKLVKFSSSTESMNEEQQLRFIEAKKQQLFD